ncbi:MAG: S-layer homology domain-containing protein [Tepidibacillus sp.]
MKHTARLWISYVLVLTLVFSIVPMTGINFVKANSPIVISDPMGTADSPTPVTTSKINISGSYYGVTDLSYTVTQLRKISNNELIPIQTRDGVEKPYLSGSTFTFYDVELFEGINEITVKGKDVNGNATPAERVYVEYSRLPIILSVKYNDQDLKLNNTISDKLFNDELLIKGEVNNADTIVAKVNGATTEYTGSVLSNGTYIIAKIPLQRGKNTLEVIATNASKIYPVKLDVIYNDGNPYIGNASIKDAKGNQQTLVSPMNITTNDLTVNGDFKNFDVNDQLTFLFNSTKFSITKNEFDNKVNGEIVSEVTGSYRLTKTGSNSFELYYPSVKQNNTNYLEFTFTRGLESYKQTYLLEHFDPTLNYVTHVSGLNHTTTNKSITFYIFTKDPTLYEVRLRKPNASEFVLTAVNTTQQATETMHTFQVNLDPGYNEIIVRPNNSDVNMKVYKILYINSPDIKIFNLVNGDRIGTGAQDGILLGELVNIDLSDRTKTKITIENRSGSSSYLLSDSNFQASPYEYRFSFDLRDKLQSGANDIVIDVTDGVTTTTTRITLFYFSTVGPEAALYIDENRKISTLDTFTETTQGSYETEARYVHINGSYNNAKDIIFYLNGVRVIQESVQPQGSGVKSVAGTDPVSGETVRLKIDWDNLQFYTDYPIFLHEGPNVFEVEVISASGTSRSEKLYIARQLPPVKLLKPNLQIEKVVNSNFIEVMVEVPAADKVFIGKTEATYVKLDNVELRNLIQSLGPEIKSKYDLNNNGYLEDNELQLIDQGEITGRRYLADVFLKPGKNKVTYEIQKDGKKTKYDFEVYYAASPDDGARYKEDFYKSGNLTVFDKKLTLSFPKNTWLKEPSVQNPMMDEYKSDVFIEFGIVDRNTGKLVKIWDDHLGKFVLEEFNEPYKTLMPVRIIPPDRTGYAGQIYWIEANGDLKNVDGGLVPTNRGKITLQYDPSIRDDAQNLLAIYHFDRNKEKWVNIGGVVDTKKKTVTAPIDEFGYYTVMAKRGTYNDIINHKWAANYLQTMYAKGLMLPESYNRFGADLLTSRGEFATVLVKALDIPINAGPYINGNKLYPVNPTFVDVNPLLDPQNGFYSYEYLETAGRAGIIRGLGQGEFSPDGLLTREQAAMMIARAANYKIQSDIEKSKKALTKQYADINKINDYAIPYVEAVTKAGIMGGSTLGSTTVFNPSSYLSRAESAAIAYRLMQSLKKLPK